MSSSNNQDTAIEELVKGRELAGQLGALLEQNHDLGSIVEEILGVFSRALMFMDSAAEINGRRRKIRSTMTGGCQRRPRSRSHTMIKVKSLDDGYSWRKYGQKGIHRSKFPRCYFRCTHKHDQGCKATRQVQQSEEDPSLFIITYFGEHTCKHPIDFASTRVEEENPCIISFASDAKFDANLKQPKIPPLSPEHSGEGHVSNIPTMEGSGGHGDVRSCVDNWWWDFMEEAFDFDGLLSF
ncbi:uncharacterized protein A4U43_C08F33440 [Asparagus officinalis]|uniref:probable WRKY transcription factor 70 n=1 Tax=Asparagus officinalis TaxID=4686 RepID=UPI00098E59E0|nr:probable WRKY transcription factor 70 [Asparagus officinalis]ONK61773.1 uncharacterized protein A4U43_C08F33440 [Asparagus officinalis]